MRLPSLRDATLLVGAATVAAWLFVAQPGRVTILVPDNLTVQLDWNPTVGGNVGVDVRVPTLPPIIVRGTVKGDPTVTVTVQGVPSP